MESQPPYQIPIEDYSRMLRYRLSEEGFGYVEELVSKIYIERDDSMRNLVMLGILLRVNMCQTGNMKNESLYQDVSKKAARFGGVAPEYLAGCIKTLAMMGFLVSNPRYERGLAISARIASRFRQASF